jgi:hypothetical protein
MLRSSEPRTDPVTSADARRGLARVDEAPFRPPDHIRIYPAPEGPWHHGGRRRDQQRLHHSAVKPVSGRWDPYIEALAPLMGCEMPEGDPAG